MTMQQSCKICIPDIKDDEFIGQLLEGVKPDIRRQVIVNDQKTVYEFLSIARRIETSLKKNGHFPSSATVLHVSAESRTDP